MSGLDPTSIDLAVSSKCQIASVLRDLMPLGKYSIAIGTSAVATGDNGTSSAGTSGSQIVDSTKTWTSSQWVNFKAYVPGKGYGVITANNGTTLTVTISPAPVSTDLYIITADVNPTLGNNFQMEWDSGGSQVVVHNDYPIYSGGVFYYMTTTNPNTDTTIALASLSDTTTPYNHIFLVNGVPATHTGSLEVVASATQLEPPSPPLVGTKVIYIGWVYRGPNDEIIIRNIGRLIDLSFTRNPLTYLDFLDVNESLKVTVFPTNILRYITFFGPGLTLTVREVGLFMQDSLSDYHMLAYAKIIVPHTLLDSENLRVIWKITV